MRTIPSMVDMKRSPAEVQEAANPTPPSYPWGLCISLCQDELEKLNLDYEDVDIGDMLHMHCLAEVTSKNSSEDANGNSSCRVELQIKFISAEDEDEENEEEEASEKESPSKRLSKFYK